MPALSRMSDKCRKCKHVDDCDNKRMVACAIAELPPSSMENATMPLTAPLSAPVLRKHTTITINMGEYGTINTSLEEIQEKIKKDLLKKLQCGFRY